MEETPEVSHVAQSDGTTDSDVLDDYRSKETAPHDRSPHVRRDTIDGISLPVDKDGNVIYNAESFDIIARKLFVNVYRLLARQIYGDYGINRGVCIDVGSGPCYLSIELARITDLRFFALDISPEVMPIAIRNVVDSRLLSRFSFVIGDVQNMPFKDNFADLIVSRGSFLFWDDVGQGFREIYRVLKPGGVAFVGGGMGRLMPKEELDRIGRELERLKYGPKYWGVFAPPKEKMLEILLEAGIPRDSFKIYEDPSAETVCTCEMWMEIRK